VTSFHIVLVLFAAVYMGLQIAQVVVTCTYMQHMLENLRPDESVTGQMLGLVSTLTVLHVACLLTFLLCVLRIYCLIPRKSNYWAFFKKMFFVVFAMLVAYYVVYFGDRFSSVREAPTDMSFADLYTLVIKACNDNASYYLAEIIFTCFTNTLLYITLWRICFHNYAPNFHHYMDDNTVATHSDSLQDTLGEAILATMVHPSEQTTTGSDDDGMGTVGSSEGQRVNMLN